MSLHEPHRALAVKILNAIGAELIDGTAQTMLQKVMLLLAADTESYPVKTSLTQFLRSHKELEATIVHLRALLHDTQLEAEAWRMIAYLTPDAARAQLLAERDSAQKDLVNLRLMWNEREPQLYAAERKIELLEDELKRIQSKAA